MIRLLTVLALLAAPAVSSAQALDGVLKKIHDSKTISIAYRTDALPFAYDGKDKQPAGYTVDLCKAVVASLERQLKVTVLQIKWVPATSQNRLDLVRKGQADMECGSTTVTLSRMKEVDFSSYIFLDSTGVLARRAAGAKTSKELAGKRIGVVSNTTNATAVDVALKKLAISATVVRMKNRDEGLAALEAGSIDAFASDKILLLGVGLKMKDPTQYVLFDDDLSFEPYAIVLPRGDVNFRVAVNQGLSEIYRSGQIVSIFKRAFGTDLEPTPPLLLMYGLGAYPN